MDTTCSGNITKPMTLEIIKKARELLNKYNPVRGEPFAIFMELEGYDCKKDYMIIPERIAQEVRDALLHNHLPLPPYVKVSKDIEKVMLVRGIDKMYQYLKPVSMNIVSYGQLFLKESNEGVMERDDCNKRA